ncbi:hypothetical protein C8J56DRAFT_28887 [Mycena floridula]|nr:hypothetical protein C8J56DRAFT_28887 [Mycena floridula]
MPSVSEGGQYSDVSTLLAELPVPECGEFPGVGPELNFHPQWKHLNGNILFFVDGKVFQVHSSQVFQQGTGFDLSPYCEEVYPGQVPAWKVQAAAVEIFSVLMEYLHTSNRGSWFDLTNMKQESKLIQLAVVALTFGAHSIFGRAVHVIHAFRTSHNELFEDTTNLPFLTLFALQSQDPTIRDLVASMWNFHLTNRKVNIENVRLALEVATELGIANLAGGAYYALMVENNLLDNLSLTTIESQNLANGRMRLASVDLSLDPPPIDHHESCEDIGRCNQGWVSLWEAICRKIDKLYPGVDFPERLLKIQNEMPDMELLDDDLELRETVTEMGMTLPCVEHGWPAAIDKYQFMCSGTKLREYFQSSYSPNL